MGTFKDRFLLQNDPFTLIEALAIAGFALGAGKAYIYLRGEYRYLLSQLKKAVDETKKKGLLDHMDIDVAVGAGAYVCGEETALMNSIEGSRGDARYKPPFPPQKGLWARPTIINNVETLMNVPAIIEKGADWFCRIGTAESKGTKVFSVSGDVAAPGVYELELGSLPVRAGGRHRGRCEHQDGPGGRRGGEDHPGLGHGRAAGLREHPRLGRSYRVRRAPKCDRCRSWDVRIFSPEESCGKCTPCREGTEMMVEILRRGLPRRSGGRRRYRGARRPRMPWPWPRSATRAGSAARSARHSADSGRSMESRVAQSMLAEPGGSGITVCPKKPVHAIS